MSGTNRHGETVAAGTGWRSYLLVISRRYGGGFETGEMSLDELMYDGAVGFGELVQDRRFQCVCEAENRNLPRERQHTPRGERGVDLLLRDGVTDIVRQRQRACAPTSPPWLLPVSCTAHPGMTSLRPRATIDSNSICQKHH